MLRPHVAQVSKGGLSGIRAHSTLRSISDLTVAASPLRIQNWTPFDSVRPLTPSRICDLSPLLSLSSSKFILVFDMVAEQSPDCGPDSFAMSFCPVESVMTTTRPTTHHITSSSGEERPHWSSELQEESDIKMFTNDPKLSLDCHHRHHSMVSNPHMSNGQKSYSCIFQSLTIRSLFQSSMLPRVTRMSSQRECVH